MRGRSIAIGFLLVALAGLVPGARPAFAGEPKQAEDKKPLLDVKEELKDTDPLDKVQKNSYAKIHEVKLAAGKTYKIEMRSSVLDSFLRLEDADGKTVAADDDSAGGAKGLDARIVFPATKEGTYKIIATTPTQFQPKATGPYTLIVTEASKSELLLAKAARLASLKPEEQKEIVAEVRKIFTDKGKNLDSSDFMLAMNIASSMERGSDKKLAAEIYQDFGKALAMSSDAKVSGFGQAFQGAARRLKLVGQPMELKGTLADGKKFDWAPYKGKVVLVDFWATWCGPCIQELPNVLKAYEKYNKQGFEIIGVSLDNNVEALTRFVEKEKMPWANIYEQGPRGWDQPLVKHYGVMSIPFTVLIGRDGNVIAMNVRGPALERELEKLLSGGEKEKEKDSK